MKRVLMAVVCLFGLAMASPASAALVNINGQLVPSELVGTNATYRLIFVTAGATAAVDTNKGFYDTFVQNEANRPGSVFQGKNSLYNWEAVITVGGPSSVTSTAANVLTGNSLGGLGVYNLGGVSLGTGTDIVNNGDVLAPVSYHQFMSSAGDSAVWTGSTKNGTGAYTGGTGSSAAWLGSPTYGAIGLSSAADSGWIAIQQNNGVAVTLQKQFGGISGFPLVSIGLPVYGISGELTAVPEPSTIALWSICAGAIGLVAWRKRRKSS